MNVITLITSTIVTNEIIVSHEITFVHETTFAHEIIFTNEIKFVNVFIIEIKFAFVITFEIYELFDFRDVRFRYRNDLLYYIFDFDSKRLCIFAIMKIEIFRQIYDFTHYENFMRTYNRLRNFIYVHSMIKHFKIYIIHCSKCQINQIKRHFAYDEFTFIILSTIFFHTITMNFIVKLLFNRDMNVLFTITCKFFKKILLISNHDI